MIRAYPGSESWSVGLALVPISGSIDMEGTHVEDRSPSRLGASARPRRNNPTIDKYAAGLRSIKPKATAYGTCSHHGYETGCANINRRKQSCLRSLLGTAILRLVSNNAVVVGRREFYERAGVGMPCLLPKGQFCRACNSVTHTVCRTLPVQKPWYCQPSPNFNSDR
jgi:hypothetical protein